MRARIAVQFLLAIVAAGCSGAANQEYTSLEGRYRVQFPGKPKLTDQTVPTALGPIVAKIASTEDWSRTARLILYADYPAALIHPGNRDPMLDGACQGMATEAKLVILAKVPMSLNSHPGREVSFEAQPGHPAGKLTGRARIFLVGSRLYQIFIAGPPGRLTPESIDSFLNSFKLLDQPSGPANDELVSGASARARSPLGFYTVPEPASTAILADVQGPGRGDGGRLPFPGSEDRATPSAPTASAGGASIRSFQWVDENADIVGGNGDSARSDGTKDQHFRMSLELPTNTILEELVVTSGGFHRWMTQPSDQFWPIAIFQNGRPVVRSQVAQVGVYSGPQKFDLYFNTSIGIGPGTPFELQVVVSIAGNRITLGSQCTRPEHPSVAPAEPRPPTQLTPASPSPDAAKTPPEARTNQAPPVNDARLAKRPRELTEVPDLLKPSSGGASIVSFEWLDHKDNRVGTSSRVIEPGGGEDEHYQLVLELPPGAVIEEIVITGGGVLRWTTKPSTMFWPVAVFAEQRPVNRGQSLRVGTFSGRWALDLYVESHGTVRPDHVFGVEVTVMIRGTRHSLTARCRRK